MVCLGTFCDLPIKTDSFCFSPRVSRRGLEPVKRNEMVVEVPIMDVEVTVGQASNTAVALLLLGDTPGGGGQHQCCGAGPFFYGSGFFCQLRLQL